jgi:exopolyphosphatase / guanosine-5'-triphosphate,3'-diphosphate pyrophosphatase
MNRKSQPFGRSDLVPLVANMRFMNREEILKIPGMEPKRADLILAGALVFEEILFFLGAKKFYVTQFALRDGILDEFLSETKRKP